MTRIDNAMTGHQYAMLQTADAKGARLVMEVRSRARSDEPPAHYHPEQAEHFRVLPGEMIARMQGALLAPLARAVRLTPTEGVS